MFDLIIKKYQKKWKLDKKTHREKGPVIEWEKGPAFWCKNGYLHRENNLPAVEYPNGIKEYYLNGEQYVLQENGTKEFVDAFFKKLHRRKGLPAIEYPNGDREWWFKGIRHRDNGPAVIIGNKQFWFEYGEFIKYKDSSEHSIIPKTKNFFKAFASLILPKRKKKSVS